MKIPKSVELVIKEFVKVCKKKLGENLVSIVLFGSYAREKHKETSDVDLLVIANKLPKEWQKRKKLFESAVDKFYKKYGKYIEVIPLTREEFLLNIEHHNSFLITLLLGHKVLFDKNFFVNSFRDFASALKKENFMYYEGGEKWEIKKLAEKYLQSFG